MSEYILELKNITKRFPGVIALKDVSLSLKKGEVLAICGENGAGKSTLMKVLSGNYSTGQYDGEIWMDGQKVDFTSVKVAEDHGIEMVYQEINVMLDSSVAENIFVGNLPLKGKSTFVDFKKLYADAQVMMDKVGLNADPKQNVRGMNSGQMQMISIARALARNPRIIVLDEPTSALSDRETEILMGSVDRLRREGVSFLFISHKMDEIFQIADRVTVMRDGAVIFTEDVKNTTRDQLITGMIGRKLENMYPKVKAEIGEEVLRVEHLTVPHPTNKGQNIVSDISFSLKRGEILGIGGLVGSGRSETLSAIFGYLNRRVEKHVYVRGSEAKIHSPGDAIRLGLGYVTEERKQTGFIWMHSIKQNLVLANLREITKRSGFIDKKKESSLAKTMFDKLSVKAPSMETMMVTLSGGNQQKVVVGKWLLASPSILFVDEPTKGIDVGTKAEIYTILCDLAQKGVSIILVSSDMPELVSMSDRVLVFSGGKITGELSGDEITQENVMRAAVANR